MRAVALSFLFALASRADDSGPPGYRLFDSPPHNYSSRTPRDRFTQKLDYLANDLSLDRSSEKAFVISFLKALEVPASSQMLVFSTTSFQSRLISPSNPRAIYFNEDIYVGYVPGGRLEVIALDPDLGAIFYIFDIPKEKDVIRFERSDRCMNCHVNEDTGFVPGLVIRSVVPGPGGGSLDAFRIAQSGHGIPFSERFGGWHVTGKNNITNHWGNLTGRFVAGVLNKITNAPGQRFDFNEYPVATSDLLPHLLHEHQVGFVNRVVEAAYRARTILSLNNGQFTDAQSAELDDQARIVTRYLLFADEVPLPSGGIEPDPAYKSDFLVHRRATSDGTSLKDLDLTTRLFKYRCSYMIYSPIFAALSEILKMRIYDKLNAALNDNANDKDYSYLEPGEKESIRRILKETLKDLPGF